nr:DUF2290 domain-containing protein [uncultured Hyphomonas sp.]
MANPIDTRDEINAITSTLVGLGLADNQNYAVYKRVGEEEEEVTFKPDTDTKAFLKNIPYADAYEEMKRGKYYNVMFPDGALLQIYYLFRKGSVSRHRLAFLPSPNLLEYQNEPELYDQELMFADMVDKSVVATPVRFDFDEEQFEEIVHPMAHMTIGQYRNCRVPMSSALGAFRFFEFVLSSFYNTAYREIQAQIISKKIVHKRTITEDEAKRVHVGLECTD